MQPIASDSSWWERSAFIAESPQGNNDRQQHPAILLPTVARAAALRGCRGHRRSAAGLLVPRRAAISTILTFPWALLQTEGARLRGSAERARNCGLGRYLRRTSIAPACALCRPWRCPAPSRHGQRLVLLQHAAGIDLRLHQLNAVAPKLGQVLQRALGFRLVEQHAVAYPV